MHLLTAKLRPRLSLTLFLLLSILLVALGLRLYGINWDEGYGFHPDERSIYMRAGCMYDVLTESPRYESKDCIRRFFTPETETGLPSPGIFLDADRSPLNPHWFPLGSILIYVIVFFRSIVEMFTDVTDLEMRYVGRTLSALADVGTVFMVYVLGRRMFSRGVGLLAAALTALAVIHIQNSHFYRPETFSVLFTLASFWAMLRMVERQRWRDSAILGLLVGLALAPKVNILPLVLPLALAYGYRVLDSVDGRWSAITPQIVQRVLAHAALAVVTAMAVVFTTAPYALLDIGDFVGDLTGQFDMVRNAGNVPFTVQYINTPAFLYQIRQSALWGLGLPLGIVAWVAIPFTVVMALRRRETRRADLLLLAWVVPNLLLLESVEVRFQRYIFPLMPFMVLVGARMLLWLVSLSRGIAWSPSPLMGGGWDGGDSPSPQSSPARREVVKRRLLRWTGRPVSSYLGWAAVALVVFVVGATAFYALAFERVYANEHPAVAASRWMQQNVPPGTAIVSDNHWDEFVPELRRYNVWQFPGFSRDTPSKMGTLARELARAEYLVSYSNLPYGSIARVPDRYPRSANYYQQLFRGELGYYLERSFTSYPGLLGVAFEDDPFGRAGLPRPEPLFPRQSAPLAFNLGYADDNVIGYDHPQVLLFRNVEKLPESTLQLRLAEQQATPETGLMLSEEDKATQRNGGTWSEIIDRGSWANRVPVLAWLLVLELVYLATLPLAMFLFRPLPDRGIVLARVLGLLLVGYVAWLLASLGWVGFSRGSVFLGILAVGLLSGLVLMVHWREIKGFLVQHWRLLLIGEVLFLVAFLAFVAIRAANPDLWHPFRGGEKPMELAYFNAVLRSTIMPPYDPWFAGGYLNYYYWGYFVVASLTKVTGIIPTTAFNLAVPMFFALTVTGAYSLVYNLTEGVRRTRLAGVAGSPPSDVVLKISNVTEGEAYPALSVAGGGGPWQRLLWSPVTAGLVTGLLVAVIGNLDGIVQLGQGTWDKVVDGQGFPSFDFWRSSRMVPRLENFDPSPLAFWVQDKVSGSPDPSSHITEFPFFTFLFADLHAHMMVIPFSLLVVGLGLNLVVGLRSASWSWLVPTTLVLALALGALWVINSWDYPPYLLLTLALLGLGVYFRPGTPRRKLTLLAVLGLGVVVFSVLAFLPFHQAYESFNNEIVVSQWRTPVDRYLGVHGLFLFVVATFLIYHTRHRLWQILSDLLPSPPGIVDKPISVRSSSPGLAWRRALLALALLVVVFMSITGYWTVAMLLVLLTLAGLATWDRLISGGDERPFVLVPLALLCLALVIGIGVDLVRLEGDVGRMNTFFKFYLQAWVLFSLAAGYMLWHLGTRGGFQLRRPGWFRGIWMGVLVLLIGSSLIYTVLGTRARLDDRFNSGSLTLDGAAYMEGAVHWEEGQPLELKWDLEAIRWLQDNVEGSPVVLEAHNQWEQYRWTARIANYTGLPTIIGWNWHQRQQRVAYEHLVWERGSDVQEIYNTTNLRWAEELLRKYEVKYIVVGELERVYYSPEGLRKFDRMVTEGLIRPVFKNEGVEIYRSIW